MLAVIVCRHNPGLYFWQSDHRAESRLLVAVPSFSAAESTAFEGMALRLRDLTRSPHLNLAIITQQVVRSSADRLTTTRTVLTS